MEKQWKKISDYEGYYKVCNFGEIKRSKRLSKSRKNGGYKRELKEVFLKKSEAKGGYYTVSLTLNGKTKKHYVHNLVAEAFIGKKEKGYEVDHIDNNPKNNKADNLQYLTSKENKMKANKRIGKRGVQKRNSGKYRARINIDGLGTVNIGEYRTIEEAYASFFKVFTEWHGVSPW